MAKGRAVLRVAASQRWIVRPSIRGGSAADPLTEKIRAALLAGTLPRINGTSWAGTASRDCACACCGEVIHSGVIEYEPRDVPGRYAHLGCFTVWDTESARLEAGHAEPGAAAAGA